MVLAMLEGGDSTKVPCTDPPCLELICSEFSDVFEKLGTPLDGAIKHKIELLPDSVLSAKR